MNDSFNLSPIHRKIIYCLALLVIILLFSEIGLRAIYYQRKAKYTSAVSAALHLIKVKIRQYNEIKDARQSPVGGPYKVIAEDFTGDGIIDLALAYYPVGILTIEQGDGKGNFMHLALNSVCEDCDSSYRGGIYNISSGDIDKDMLKDLIIGCRGNFILVLKNMGNGKFKRMKLYRTESAAKGVKLADLNNDGILDLLYTARGTGRQGDTPGGKLYIRQGMGQWSFGAAIYADAGKSAYYVETADLNGDEYLDILVPNELSTKVSYWINPGKGIFSPPYAEISRLEAEIGAEVPIIPGFHLDQRQRRILQTSGRKINDVRAADFNGDGHKDVVTANWESDNISVFLWNGESFHEDQLLPGGPNCAFMAVGDLDNDGDQDFVATNWTEDFLSIFLNKGKGEFAPRKEYKTALGNYGVTIFDSDGDGSLDIVTANFMARSISILKGRGDGTFDPANTIPNGFQKEGNSWVREKTRKSSTYGR